MYNYSNVSSKHGLLRNDAMPPYGINCKAKSVKSPGVHYVKSSISVPCMKTTMIFFIYLQIVLKLGYGLFLISMESFRVRFNFE